MADKNKNKNKTWVMVALLAAVIVISLAVYFYFFYFNNRVIDRFKTSGETQSSNGINSDQLDSNQEIFASFNLNITEIRIEKTSVTLHLPLKAQIFI